MFNNIVMQSSFLGEIDDAQTIPEKIHIIQVYLKKLEDGKKERAERRKQLEETAKHLQERRDALRDQRKSMDDEKKQLEDLKKAIGEQRRRANITDDQKKALDEEEKAVEEREKVLQESKKETEVKEIATEDEQREVEIEKKDTEDVDSAQDTEGILLWTKLQTFVDSSTPLSPPATATGPSTSLGLAPPGPPASSIPAATFPRPPTAASGSSFIPLRLRPPTGVIIPPAPTFSTLPMFPPPNISTQPMSVGPSDVVTLGPRYAARLTWTDQLTQAFDEAIQSLGGLNSASVTAKEVKRLMNDARVTESQVFNRIKNQRRKHDRDDGGESSSSAAKKQC